MITPKKWLIPGVISLMLVLSACGNSASKGNMDGMDMGNSPKPSSAASSSGVVTVVSTDWKWEMSQTTFKKGETVTFSIQGKKGVHGFAIDGTDIDQRVAPGETKEVKWTPDKAGEFTIKCSIACGTGHADMVQKITVSE